MPRPVPKETDKVPTLSWANNKPLADGERMHAGFFIDAGLDNDLDQAAERAGWERGAMTHLDGGNREHWLLPRPTPLHFLCLGLPYTSMTMLARNADECANLGFRAIWKSADEGTGERGGSRLIFRVAHPDLIAAGFIGPVPASFRASQTDYLIKAMLRHNAILDQAEAYAQEQGKDRQYEFWEFALPIMPGPVVQVGKTQQSPIRPIQHQWAESDPNTDALRSLYTPVALATWMADDQNWNSILDTAQGRSDSLGAISDEGRG